MPIAYEGSLHPDSAHDAPFANTLDRAAGQAGDLLTIGELARVLRIGRTRVYELAQRDELPIPSLRVGCQYRFSQRALDTWLNRQHPDRVNAA